MLLGRTRFAFVSQLSQGAANAETRVARFDNVVDVTIFGSLVGVGKEVVLFFFLFGEECRCGFLRLGFLTIENSHSTRCTHYGDFGRGPCVVKVGLELLAAHHDV